jgi:hypothetical protein
MRLLQSDSLSQVLNVLRRIMDGPQMLAFLPAAVLAAFWLALGCGTRRACAPYPVAKSTRSGAVRK